jgi:alkanesulfonate monooxygenase SsuD/methylene tetrahydromethanopterin reductase-like flavin-dependent oxidoreductase (luciferase family)
VTVPHHQTPPAGPSDSNGSGPDTGLTFGIFDWIDDGGDRAIDYLGRLRLLEYADTAGFWGYHLAEHHGSPLGGAPSPNVFLGAVAARTRQLRLGPLVSLLPLYNPLRLLEEICMLDQLSQGRLELGVGRGVSPVELALFGVDAAESRAMFEEALQVILTGLTTGRLDFEGTYYRYHDVPVALRPRQQPYPPLWYPASNPDSVPWIGQHGFNTLSAWISEALFRSQGTTTSEQLARYAQELAQHRADGGRLNGHVPRPRYGIVRHVYVAETDQRARDEARPAHDRFFAHFNQLWLERLGREVYPANFDAFVDAGFLLVGAPGTVAERVAHELEAAGGGLNYFVSVFAFGGLQPERYLRSIDLFAREVMPAVRGARLGRSAVRDSV